MNSDPRPETADSEFVANGADFIAGTSQPPELPCSSSRMEEGDVLSKASEERQRVGSEDEEEEKEAAAPDAKGIPLCPMSRSELNMLSDYEEVVSVEHEPIESSSVDKDVRKEDEKNSIMKEEVRKLTKDEKKEEEEMAAPDAKGISRCPMSRIEMNMLSVYEGVVGVEREPVETSSPNTGGGKVGAPLENGMPETYWEEKNSVMREEAPKSNGTPLCPMSLPGDLEPGRVFHVLDEYNNSDVEEDAHAPDASSESDISDTEIEKMLESGLKENGKPEKEVKNKGGAQYIERKYISLEELGHNHFDVLPEGWIQIAHKSGMPVYLHKSTRVCTFARPYYLGQGSARRHQVPLSAIPCLQYKRSLEEEKVEKEKAEASNTPQGVQMPLRTAKIETAEENKASQSLGAFTIMQYCKSLFRFKTAQRLKFISWPDRRRYTKARRIEKQNQRPCLPDDTKLIKFPIQNLDDPDGKPKGEWIMNPNGKSYICILHEYVQHALKKQPTYEYKSLENPATPYSATVIISGMRYGCGVGTSKKHAKLDAARASLEILIPEMREKIKNDEKNGKRTASTVEEDDSLSIFDAIKVEDPRVAEFCAKTTEPSPFAILLTCLQRNFDSKCMPIDYKVNPLHRQMNEFIMTVGNHKARVVCKNKKDGKQRASQAILQKLHPYINSWGSLLRLYGNRSMRNVKERKHEEQEITMLQSKASLNSPNYAILEKLKSEMLKINDENSKRKPIGVFIPPLDVPLPSSGTQLSKVDL